MYITGFDSYDNYNPVSVNVIDTYLDELQGISTSEVTYNGITFRKTRDDSSFININIASRNRVNNIGEIATALAHFGAYLHGYDEAFTVQSFTTEPTSVLVSKNHGSVSSYYYLFQKKTADASKYHAEIGGTQITQGTSGSYVRSYLAPIIARTEDHFYYGLIGFRVDGSSISTSGQIQIRRDFNESSYIEPEYDAGEKGFRPTSSNTKRTHPGTGGRGTSHSKNPAYNGDNVTQPGAPDETSASAIGSGFLNLYKLDTANLNNIGKCLYSTTLLTALQNLTINPLDFIVSLMVFPCQPISGTSEDIRLGGWVCDLISVHPNGLDTKAVGTRLSKQYEIYDFGSVIVPENWGSFLDYSQTSIELYLPFIGSIQLDPSECMGGTVNVQYTVDFLTGQCVANVLCTKTIILPSGVYVNNANAQHSYQGNCAVQIPLSAVNYGSMIGSLINACTQSISNPVTGFMGIASDAIAGGFRPSVTSKGNIVANSGFCAVLYPYIRLTRPITAVPESYQETIGLPSYINTTLGECDDLCICDSINLAGVTGATESEMNRIRQMCMEGVYV